MGGGEGRKALDEEAGFGRRIGVLTVVRLQSVGMCGCVAGVAGAALEAVVVLLLAIADAVHAVHLARGELHALNVHLCETERTNTNGYFQRPQTGNRLLPPGRGRIHEGSPLRLWIKPGFRRPLPLRQTGRSLYSHS